MSARIVLLLLTAIPIAAGRAESLAARASRSAPISCPRSEEFTPKIRPGVRAARLARSPTIDGSLEEATWENAAHVTGFSEFNPGDQTRPDVCTEVFVGYDEGHLYVGFLAHDFDPASIRASRRNRDQIFGDDFVGLLIDPYGDGAQAYEIFANPYGIQGDLLMSSSGREDAGFDLVYQSEGRISPEGYEVEMAIPFGSLRFPDEPDQTWRVTFARTRPRASRQQYAWSAVDRDDPCIMCQLGTLSGIDGIAPSTNLDVLPALVGSRSAGLADPDAPRDGLEAGSTEIQPSLNLRYDITPSLAAEATVNPDFSQVESDAARIDVNQTFALSYPERRPFFQEGSELFDTWIDVVYTRSINAPIAAAKTTGRFGRTELAYLSAIDRKAPMLLPFEEESATLEVGRSASNVLRARRSIGKNSFVGATVTDQRYLDDAGSGSVLSADARIQLGTNYRLETQWAVSRIDEPRRPDLTEEIGPETFDRGAHTAALDGERYAGTGAFVSFDRSARHWRFDLSYAHNSPTFRTPNGFERQNDFRLLRGRQGYEFYFDEASFVERLRPSVFASAERNFAGVAKEARGGVGLWARMKGQTQIWTEVGTGRERFDGVRFPELPFWNFGVNSSFSDPVRLGFNANGGHEIYRGGEDPMGGKQLNVNLWGTLQPFARLTVEPNVSYARMRAIETDTTFFEGYTIRARTSVQFTRRLSLRLVTQYDHFSGHVDLEPLLSYEINPFTVFHFGTAHDFGPADDPGRAGLSDLVQTERQLFFKLQYLFQL